MKRMLGLHRVPYLAIRSRNCNIYGITYSKNFLNQVQDLPLVGLQFEVRVGLVSELREIIVSKETKLLNCLEFI